MIAYLVLLVYTEDAIPVRLFSTYSAALTFAMEMSVKPEPFIRKLFDTDCSTPVTVKLVEFCDGKPSAVDLVKSVSLEADEQSPRFVQGHIE